VERGPEAGTVRLADASLEAAGLERPPDVVVDATGRRRLLARLLELPSVAGRRRDVALHAHMEGVALRAEGDVHTDRLDHGWCWRIPLPGRVSVGLVMDAAVAAELGSDREEQFDTCLRHDPMLREWGATAKRITPVLAYTNYQLRATRGVGPAGRGPDGAGGTGAPGPGRDAARWALVGDAFGFVDPVFSSGLLLALDRARELADALARLPVGPPRPARRLDAALRRYESRMLRHIAAWQRVCEYFYDGRLFTLLKVGERMRTRFPFNVLDPHFQKHMPRVFTGEATAHRYSMGLLDFMIRHGLAGTTPQDLAIR